ncbi:MAG: host attachment protein [Candidatus Paceibacterota bacterium]
MQIPQELPQFKNTPTLLIVTGSQYAKFFYALNGAIEEITELKTPTPTYNEREGFFLRSGRGMTMGSWSVYESKSKSTEDTFIEQLNTLLNSIRKEIDIDEVLLSAPEHDIQNIRAHLTSPLQKKITHQLHGNYTKLHPTELLKKMK